MGLFGTAGVRGPVTDRLTPDLAVRFGQAVASELPVPDQVVSVARDGRTSGPGLEEAVTAGLLAGGVTVRRLGVVTTPLLAFASRLGVGVMVTASHNPPGDNGLKLFIDGQEADRDVERVVEGAVAHPSAPARWDRWAAPVSASVQRSYLRTIDRYTASFGAVPDGLSVCLDAGTGTGAMTTASALRAAGAEVAVLNGQVDGHFPARPSKPTAQTLQTLSGVLAAGSFDLGIAHDGDADRVVFLDSAGEVIHEDTVTAVIATALIETADTEDPIVITTPNASTRIDAVVTAAGGQTVRVGLGDLQAGLAEHGDAVVFAAEPWKHIHPGLGGWIDGTASAVVFTRLLASSGLDRLVDPIDEQPYRKLSIDCPDARKRPVMQALATAIPELYPEATIEQDYGLRMTLPDDGWALLRPSGTEPKFRIYAESQSVDALVEPLIALVEDSR
jgi:phosphomannomutase